MNPGSSPHTRGTRITPLPSPKIRFIPACAGNAGSGVSSSSVSPVHPRMRGERSAGGRPAWACLGSSPHARGTRQGVPPLSEALRFIPACAGNAGTSPASTARHSVHPRMRGERGLVGVLKPPGGGSSPHTRGTHDVCLIDTPPSRFIPAYAGNARRRRCPSRPVSVHPRIRGERSGNGKRLIRSIGSSPHTRGTRIPIPLPSPKIRFIPAYAGNANWLCAYWRTSSVHPRIRGERQFARQNTLYAKGSSPHTRGTPGTMRRQPYPVRFIPAYAGNATRPTRTSTSPTVHPRIRGERFWVKHSYSAFPGSSPHTRGTRAVHVRGFAGHRFIPAYAGNADPGPSGMTGHPVHPRMRGERTSNKLLIYLRKSEPSDSTNHSGC